MLNRAVNAHATDAEKKQVIDCLYAVAAADDLVSDVEEQEIRRIAGALLVSHWRVDGDPRPLPRPHRSAAADETRADAYQRLARRSYVPPRRAVEPVARRR